LDRVVSLSTKALSNGYLSLEVNWRELTNVFNIGRKLGMGIVSAQGRNWILNAGRIPKLSTV